MRNGRRVSMTVMVLALAGCGGGDGGSSTLDGTAAGTAPPASAVVATGGSTVGGSGMDSMSPAPGTAGPNVAPSLSGAPPTSAVVDQDYEFQPSAADPDGDALRFSAAQLPAWMGLDPASGRLSGRPRPGDQGVFGPIVLTVSDGRNTVELPAFTVTVAPPGQGQAQGIARRGFTLTWQAPERNSDGSPIGRPPTYRIHVGRASGAYERQVDVGNPGVTRYTFTDLEHGQWFLAMTSVGEGGVESDYSDETRAVVN